MRFHLPRTTGQKLIAAGAVVLGVGVILVLVQLLVFFSALGGLIALAGLIVLLIGMALNGRFGRRRRP